MQLLQDMSPYLNFGYFTANQAILEAVVGERRVHVVDFDIGEGAQWPPLIQALVSTRGSSPAPSHLKITAVTRGRKSAASTVVKETGRRLAAFAASVGLPFSFAQCRLDREECFRPEAVRLMHGEPIVFNCAIHQPHHLHHPPKSVESFLAGAAKMGARLVTVVEEEKGGEAANEGRFFGRFMEEVQRYSAMWDALEAGFPQQGMVRETVENVVFAPRIISAVEMAFFQREETAAAGFAEKMVDAGFRGLALGYFNLLQAKLMLGLFNEGYHIDEAEPNKLVLCWKSRPLVSASIWSCLQPPPPQP
ncbi:hypothetical protein HPP92_004118 [Vanilla planifolia]|uniref:Uncharacterized protein n=1 Tax=Vanilla planifolia TaxID=51239 RepID=A0A835S9L8_VANPL|nr:hypothetical protein HPP92_004118 [Vanilla planifolia]